MQINYAKKILGQIITKFKDKNKEIKSDCIESISSMGNEWGFAITTV